MKTLGGCFWVKDGEKYDYCYKETLKCLQQLCDKVVVVEIGSTDGTAEALDTLSDEKTTIIHLPEIMWEMAKTRWKISYFQNIASGLLDTDYYFLCQADEIVSDYSHDTIRKAMETGKEGFAVTRYNLWGKTCNTMLNVPQERKPCSTRVMRLSKPNYFSWEDGENIAINPCSDEFVNDIKIFHYGFVRKKEIMPYKIENMLVNIFGHGETDKKAPVGQDFNPDLFFGEEDLIPIPEPHPKIMEEWLKTRP